MLAGLLVPLKIFDCLTNQVLGLKITDECITPSAQKAANLSCFVVVVHMRGLAKLILAYSAAIVLTNDEGLILLFS